jgi:predicted amidophosphoribosyltransferase
MYVTKQSNLTVHSTILYTPVAAKIILAAKENGAVSADNMLIDAIIWQIQNLEFNLNNIRLVPIPSSKRSIRNRGEVLSSILPNKFPGKPAFPY